MKKNCFQDPKELILQVPSRENDHMGPTKRLEVWKMIILKNAPRMPRWMDGWGDMFSHSREGW